MHLSSSYPTDLVDEVTNETFDIAKGVYALAYADNSIDDLSFLDDRFKVNNRLRRVAARFVFSRTSPDTFYIDFNPAVWDSIKGKTGEVETTSVFYDTCSNALQFLKDSCSI